MDIKPTLRAASIVVNQILMNYYYRRVNNKSMEEDGRGRWLHGLIFNKKIFHKIIGRFFGIKYKSWRKYVLKNWFFHHPNKIGG